MNYGTLQPEASELRRIINQNFPNLREKFVVREKGVGLELDIDLYLQFGFNRDDFIRFLEQHEFHPGGWKEESRDSHLHLIIEII